MKRVFVFGSAAFVLFFSAQTILGIEGRDSVGLAGAELTPQSEVDQAVVVQSNLLSATNSGNNAAGLVARDLPATVVIDRNKVNFGPAPNVANGGPPNSAAVAFRESMSTPANQLIAEISPKWARAAQVSESIGDTAAQEFALGMIQRLAAMSMEVGVSEEDVVELHLASHQHFENTLGGPKNILVSINSGEASGP